jgi:hypothetical protein
VRFELVPETLQFRERARVGDRRCGLIGEHSEPAKLLLIDRPSAKHREHT